MEHRKTSVRPMAALQQTQGVYLLSALKSLLQLQAQMVGGQPKLGADPLGSGHAWPEGNSCRPTRKRPSGGYKPQTLWPHSEL